MRERRGIERAEAGIGRSHQHGAVVELHADIAGRPACEAAVEQRAAHRDDAVAQLRRLGKRARHTSLSHALMNMSSEPKLPDLSASATGRPRKDARIHGTPGSISAPMSSAVTPSPAITAPELSPPATMMRENPAPASLGASLASKSST